MTTQEIFDEVAFITKTDSVIYTNAEKLTGLNLLQNEAKMIMLRAQGYKHVTEDEFTTDFLSVNGLISGDFGYDGEYTFDTTWIKPYRFDVKFSTNTEFKTCKLYDYGQNDQTEVDQDSVQNTFDILTPEVRFQRDSYKIRPLNTGDTVVDGIHIWAETRQVAIAQTYETPILDVVFHDWYVKKLALRYGKFRPGINRSDILLDVYSIEEKIYNFYKIKERTQKIFNVSQVNFS